MNHDDRFRSCTSKMAFANKKQAKSAVKEITERKRTVNMRAYKCRYCPFWHMGRSQSVGRSVEERVTCPRGCGNQIRQSRLEKHLTYCDGVGDPTLADHQTEAQDEQEEIQTSDPYRSDQEQDLG